MRTKLVSVLSLLALSSILGGCGAAATGATAYSPRYYPAPAPGSESTMTSQCAVSVCDSHTASGKIF
jgi:ABC-type uncharacterized transport system auxiliary subunit